MACDSDRNLHRHCRTRRIVWDDMRNDTFTPRCDPDGPTPRAESDAEGIERRITEAAAAFRRVVEAAADRRGRPLVRCGKSGRFLAGGTDGATAERDVTVFLTAEAFDLTLSQLVRQMAISCRGVALRRRRAGAAIVEAGRERLRNESRW